jgi:hypothetical protein
MERESVNKVRTNSANPQARKHASTFEKKRPMAEKQYNVEGNFRTKRNLAPLKEKKCNACHKLNHVAKMRRSRSKFSRTGKNKVYEVQNAEPYACAESSDEEYTYNLREHHAVRSLEKNPMTSLKVNKKQCKLMIDTGATVNILDEKSYRYLGSPKLRNDK